MMQVTRYSQPLRCGVTQYMRSEVALLHSGMALDVLGTGFDQFPSDLRDAIVGRYPRKHFKEGMIQAAFDGFAHKPGTTYGTVWAGIPERFIPGYTSPNVCDLIAACISLPGFRIAKLNVKSERGEFKIDFQPKSLMGMRRFLFSLLTLVFVGPMDARSQTSCPKPPPYELLRQDENYSYLSNPSCRTDFWDPIKYMPLNSKGDRYLTLGGEIREWYEGFQNANWGEGPQDGNGYLLQRISLNSDWNLGRRIRFFGQLTSAIEAGRNGGPRPMIDEAKLWVEEGFADIALIKSEKASLTIRAGRQEFEFGSGRLVDVREGPNVRQAFDGIDMIWNSASWHVDGFATRPVLNNVNVFDDPPNHNTMFWGVYAVRPLPITKGGNIDLYYLGIDNKQATFERGTAQEIRHTIGTRFWGKRGSLDYNVEALFQLGSFGSADIRAWSVAPGAGYQLRSLPLSPQVEVRFIATSGDHPDTGTLATFNPLFPTAIYFGQGVVNLNGPSNLIGLRPAAKLQLAKDVRLAVDYDFFGRESLQDGVYGLGVNLLRSGLDNQARHIGSQPSVGIYWQLNRHFSLSAAYAHFSVGPFLTESATPGRNVNYAAIWATYEF